MAAAAAAAVVELWSSMFSWLTPTTLFIVLNLTIATIAISSSFHKSHQSKQHDHHHQQQSSLYRSPSVLQRLKSINFYHYTYGQDTHHDHGNLARAPSLLQRLKSTNFYTSHFSSFSQRDFVEQSFSGQPEHHLYQRNQETHVPENLTRAPSILERLQSTKSFYSTHFANSKRHFVEPSNSETDNHHHRHQYTQKQETQIRETPTRPPSVLERLKSITFYNTHPTSYQGHFVEHDENTSSNEAEEEQFDEYDGKSLEEVYSQLKGVHFNRSKSDTEPSADKIPPKLPSKMRKSATVKSSFGHFEEEEVEKRIPETTKERSSGAPASQVPVDHEVDAKADDFINSFKQQLRLQRLNSILRYKETLTKGKGK